VALRLRWSPCLAHGPWPRTGLAVVRTEAHPAPAPAKAACVTVHHFRNEIVHRRTRYAHRTSRGGGEKKCKNKSKENGTRDRRSDMDAISTREEKKEEREIGESISSLMPYYQTALRSGGATPRLVRPLAGLLVFQLHHTSVLFRGLELREADIVGSEESKREVLLQRAQ